MERISPVTKSLLFTTNHIFLGFRYTSVPMELFTILLSRFNFPEDPVVFLFSSRLSRVEVASNEKLLL